MMEEVGDDNNGESTFEFVGDGCVNTSVKGDSVPIPTQSPITLPVTAAVAFTTASVITSPMPQNVSSLFSMPAAVPDQFYQQMNAPPIASDNVIKPVGLYNLSHPIAGLSNIPSPSGIASPIEVKGNYQNPYQFYQPPPQPTGLQPTHSGYAKHPYIPLGQGMLPTPPPNPMTSSYPGNMPQSSLEIPFDDSFVTPPNQSYQDNTTDKGFFGWIKGSEFLNKVAEKAKNSVDSVITTLDPGMKEIIYSGGDVSLIVASRNEMKISSIREAFQNVFGKATVDGVHAQATSIAPQPVGFSAASKAAEERLSNLRQQGIVPDNYAFVAVENFLAELIPDKWFDIGCIFLQNYSSGVTLQVFTQAVPVDLHYVMQAKQQTPKDYPLSWSGYAVTIGQIMGPALGVHHSEWHQALTGVSRREQLVLAAKTLAGLYKAKLRQ